MGLEGLQSILGKEEIVATQRANDFLDRPKFVDEAYKRHVRTYVPLGRQAEDKENGQSVADFERRVIREVRQAGALRGYITAEYGHGKTSTALYLWDRARAENLLAVPPFQVNKLTDLIIATFGWVRYEVQRTRPDLLGEAQRLYDSLIERSADTVAQQYGMDISAAQRLVRARPDILALGPTDYIHFFESMTQLAQKAGFDGLLVLADELQQYIEPEIKSGVKDPISPLFDVVGAILTRRRHLSFGLIMVIPPKELALLRDQRGDLVHRVLQASLDLSAVYDGAFPERLWHRLAREFDFEDHRDRIISLECLESLGQVSSRADLADGPRTVVKAFLHATQRYIELGHPSDEPYTPYHLIDDFMSGAVPYVRKIPRIVSQALSHSLVRGKPESERAVRWAAAFPNEGVPRTLQSRIGLTAAFDELAQSTLGDLIISVGDVRNRGFTLRGLDRVDVPVDWLTMTIREFWRTYYETADSTHQRALGAFLDLLTTKVFPENQWTVVERITGGLVRNDGIVLEGSFSSFSRRFPERRIHVRVLWEDESVKDAGASGEVVVQFRLRRYLDLAEEKRRHYAEPLKFDYDTRQIEITLNLMRREDGAISPQLEQVVAPIVSPFKLTPLLLLTMYRFVEEKREKNLIPKAEDQQIQYGFQPDLLDNAFREILNATVGAPVGASQERIVELALVQLLEDMYPDYDTLIKVSNWQNSLQKYANALKHLETTHEKQGQIVYEGLKDDVATLFTLSNTGLDTFVGNFSSFLEVVREFPTRREAAEGAQGAVRFRLHNLEQKIKNWLQSAQETEKIRVGGQLYEIHRLPSNQVYRRGEQLGYKEKEIDVVLELMVDRGLVERDLRYGTLRETVSQAPSVDELASDISAWEADIGVLLGAFPQSNQLTQWKDEAEKAQRIVDERLRVKPDEEQLIRLRRSVRAYHSHLNNFARERHELLLGEAGKLRRRLPQADRRQGSVLETSVQGAVDYVEQVNDLRVRVRREYIALAGQIDQLQRAVQSTQTALGQDELSLTALAGLAEELQSQEQRSSRLQVQRESFEKRFNQFAEWAGLVEQGSRLLDEIQTLGELVEDQRMSFQDLSRDMNGHLSASKLDALPDYPTYELRLNEIAETVRLRKTEATKRFSTLQERYVDTLRQGLGFPQDQLWTRFSYNPVAPDETYRRLIQEVRSALHKMWTQLNRTLTKEQDAVRSTLVSPLLQSLPSDERRNLTRRGEELDKGLGDLQTRLASARDQVADSATLIDFPESEEGQFHKLLQAIGYVRDTTVELHQKVESLGHVLQALELTGSEKRLLETIGPEADTEISELRQQVSLLTDDEFWSALRGLHAKRRLRIVVEPVQYS